MREENAMWLMAWLITFVLWRKASTVRPCWYHPTEYIFCNNLFYFPCQPPQVQCIFIQLIQLLYYVLFPGSRKDCMNEISLYRIKILQTRPQSWPHIPLFKYTCPQFLKMSFLHCITFTFNGKRTRKAELASQWKLKRSEHLVQVS